MRRYRTNVIESTLEAPITFSASPRTHTILTSKEDFLLDPHSVIHFIFGVINRYERVLDETMSIPKDVVTRLHLDGTSTVLKTMRRVGNKINILLAKRQFNTARNALGVFAILRLSIEGVFAGFVQDLNAEPSSPSNAPKKVYSH